MVFNNNLLAGAGGQSTSFDVDYSCMFDATNDYLTKTYGSAGNQKTFTISCWVKRSKLDSSATNQGILGAGTSGNNRGGLFFVADEIHFSFNYGGSWYELKSSAKYRDTSGWMNIVTKVDTTQSTASDRTKIYVNGSEISYATSGYVPEDATLPINDDIEQVIGAYSANKAANDMFGGYMAEIYFIDGSALAPSNFGETNSSTGQWVPIDYDGSYGDNGYRLSFGTSSAMGDDTSGEENDFSLTGIAAANQSSDTPTSNSCTLNTVDTQTSRITLSNGNLGAVASNDSSGYGTMGVNSGKWYYEILCGAIGSGASFGLGWANGSAEFEGVAGARGGGYIWDAGDGNIYNNSTSGSTYCGATAPSAGERVMCALDLDNGFIYFGLEGTWFNSGDPTSGATGTGAAFSSVAPATGSPNLIPAIAPDNGDTYTINFGASSYTHTIPTGYKALNTSNLGSPAIADPTSSFHPQLYTGNGSTQSIDLNGNSTFEPAFTIIKNRDEDDSWVWTDAVRGATKIISSDTAAAEATDADTLTAFESDGFALGDDDKVNTNTEKYVSYNWKANGSGSADSDGMTKTSDSSTSSITVSADATAGFSIIKYTGNGSASTLAHGLGKAPSFIITKDLGNSRAWPVYHQGLSAATKVVYMNSYVPEATDAAVYGAAPTSSVVNIATSDESNGNTISYIMYAFAEIDGFSKFGTYTGNGANDGPFINLGFKPALFATKARGLNAQWYHWDAARNTYNPLTLLFCFDLDADEGEFAGWSMAWPVDFLSNGIKLRDDASDMNTDGQVYLYAAWAESPFKTATAR